MRRAEWLVERPWRLVVLVLLVAAPLLVMAELQAADTQRRVETEQRENLHSLALRGAEATASRTITLLEKLVGAATTPRLKGAIGLTFRRETGGDRETIEPPDVRELSFQLESFHAVMREEVVLLFALDGAGFVLETDPPGGTADGRVSVGKDLGGSTYAKAVAPLHGDSRYVGVDPDTGSVVIAVPVVQDARLGPRTSISRLDHGALVAELRPAFLERSLRSLGLSVGDLYVVDSQGRALVRLNGEVRPLQDLSNHPAVAAAVAGGSYLERANDPVTRTTALIATAPVGDFGWHIIAVGLEDPLRAEVDAGLAQQRGLRVGLIGVLVLGAALIGGASSAAIRQRREARAALEQQTALSDVLRTISRSAFDLDAVLQTIVERAAGLVGAESSMISRRDGDDAVVLAGFGPALPIAGAPGTRIPVSEATLIGRALLTGKRQYTVDATLNPDLPQGGPRTRLVIPFMRDGKAVGTLGVSHDLPRPFNDRELQMLETFADQAAIAIENVRLFSETKEALQQRTATSEILRVISETLGDPQPVMQAIVDTVLAVCSADSAGFFRRSGDDLILRAVSGTWRGPRPSDLGPQLPFRGDSIVVSALEEGRYQHVADTSADPRYDAAALWSRTRLAVPVLRGSETIGVIRVGRAEPGGFTEREIRLVEGFAEQAAIAFENARLFNETKEALEQQTAVGDVLKTISRSVFDLQPVLDTVVEHAARLAGGDVAWLARITGEDSYRILSRYGVAFESAAVKEEWGDLGTMRLATSTSVMGRLLRERVVLHVQDITVEKELWDASRLIRATKSRTILAVPMLREGQPIGGVIVGRTTQRPFSNREIQLVQTFADQAAIAIENVRLFDETRESLERQTAVAQVLGAISQSGFELKSVLETVIEHATKLCAAQQGFIYRRDGDVYRLAVAHGITPEFKAFTDANPVNPLGRGTITGRVAQDRITVHVPDVLNDPEYTYWDAQRLGNFRALLGVPMVRNDQVIGVMLLWRTEPRPFTDGQIALVTTFANQATIAIENVRLFDETKEALERQTAISEVLKVISRTTFDILPVMRTVLAHAARLCDADLAWMRRVDSSGALYESANYGRTSELTERLTQSASETREAYGSGRASYAKSIMARVINERTRIHLADITLDPGLYENSVTARINGARTVLAVPLLHDSDPVGMLVVARMTVRPFDDREQQLVDTFAQQAAIAMQNARLFTEIQDKSRQLEVASRHKSEFLANMSHELRTPLNAIIGFSEVLIQGLFGEVNEKQREYLQDVIGSGQHLLSLINDILDLSKIEAGRMELELSTFSFRNALDSGVTIVRERAARHGITLNVDVSDDLDQVEADERKVKQILYNLLSNAVKFTPDDGRVDVTVRRDNGDVRVEVRDTGIGIADSDQARVFEEFQQVGRERSREGTGLGLTLTKRFVELHSGRIWLVSAPGQGSTFTFTLPLRQAAPVRA